MMNRRRVLLGLGLLAVPSPAIVRAGSLMKVSPVPVLNQQWNLTLRYIDGRDVTIHSITCDPYGFFPILRDWTRQNGHIVLEADVWTAA